MNGAEEIRTPLEKPLKTALSQQGGAESVALSVTDPGLAAIIEAWSKLPEAMKAGILAMVKATGG